MSKSVSIVIPAFNEAQRIPETLARIDDHLRVAVRHYEIVVVDDGSQDDTRGVVERIAADRPAVRCVRYSKNRGKGHAVRVGMLAATGQIRVMMDADGSIPAAELPTVIEPVERGEADLAIGSRYVGDARVSVAQPRWRVVWSRLCNRIVQRSIAPGIQDTQCGCKAFTAGAAEDLFGVTRVNGWAFDLEVLAIARSRGYRIVERGVAWQDDPRSRVSPVRDFLKVVREWWTIRGNLRAGVYRLAEVTH